MKTLSTPEQLADAIESLVTSYLNEVRQAAQQAVERTLSRPAARESRAKSNPLPRTASTASTSRRTAAELDEVCERLCALVHSRPGESIVALAEAMAEPSGALQRPMAKLRSDGRVRTVGQRHLMRYFPAVIRPAAAKG
jgi:hypothetical protein